MHVQFAFATYFRACSEFFDFDHGDNGSGRIRELTLDLNKVVLFSVSLGIQNTRQKVDT